jgi:hypothetical protein
MADIVYREFALTNANVAQALWQFLKLNANALATQGKPLWVICTNDAKKRNNQQNSRYWGFVLAPIAEQAFVQGRRFDSAVWHEHFAQKYVPHIEFHMPDGSIHRRRKSTSELTVREFAEYMNTVEAEAACELGVQFPADMRGAA